MKKFLGLIFVFSLHIACTTTTRPAEVSVPDISVHIDKSTPAKQAKAGVEMNLLVPEIDIKEYRNQNLGETGIGQSLANGLLGAGLHTVESTPVYFPSTKNLSFRIKVKNNLDRPLRLNGAIVALELSDKIVASYQSDLSEPQQFLPTIERTAFGGLASQTKELKEREGTVWKGVSEEFTSELQRIVILPGKEREIELLAPDYVNIPAKTSFTINFLDVPTKVDAASNPTEKQGWTWIVNYDRKMSKKPVEITVENKRLTVTESYKLDSRGSAR